MKTFWTLKRLWFHGKCIWMNMQFDIESMYRPLSSPILDDYPWCGLSWTTSLTHRQSNQRWKTAPIRDQLIPNPASEYL